MIRAAKAKFNAVSGEITGSADFVERLTRTVENTNAIYAEQEIDEKALQQINYRVEVYREDEAEGGLQFGTSYLYPGTVNGEFFMTKGHYHEIKNRAEFYFCLKGKGLLLLMNEDRSIEVEEVKANSLHYIPGNVAHRLVNIGEEILTVGACWNSDAGHDYGTIAEEGFSVRVMKDEQGYKIVEMSQ